MNAKELNDVLNKHAKWLRNKSGGERADLARANLTGAYLNMAWLTVPILVGCIILGAVFAYKDWRGRG